MTSDGILTFLADHHRAVLLTRRADGDRLQTSPIVCALDGNGRIAISVTQDRAKTKNIRRDPRVTLCALSDGFFGEWVQVDGTAEIVDLPEAMPGLEALYRTISGEHPDWDEYRGAMARDKRCLIVITPED